MADRREKAPRRRRRVTRRAAAACAAMAIAGTVAGAVALDTRAEAVPPPREGPDVPRRYDAPRAAGPVTVDGRADEVAWSRVPWTEPFVDIRGGDRPDPALLTRAKMTWDAEALFVFAELEEPHLWGTLTDRDAIVYRDDDFEVFLDPDGDGRAYYELEINALGTVLDLFLDRPYARGGSADLAWDVPGLGSAVHLAGTLGDPSDLDRGWSVELRIPWSDLRPPGQAEPGRAPRPGEVWRVNFSRVDWPLVVEDGRYRKAREPVDWSDHPEENWVWSPQGEIDMHVPERWGSVRFVSGAAEDAR